MKASSARKYGMLVGLALWAAPPAGAQKPTPVLPPAPPGFPPVELIATNNGTTVIRPRQSPSRPAPRPLVKPAIVVPPRPTNTLPPRAVPMPPQVQVMPRPGMPSPATPANALAFDAELKECRAKPRETSTTFIFYVTNTANVPVQVNYVHASCGCTVPRMPAQPWRIAPGESGPISVTVDLRGKRGVLTKGLTVLSTSGLKHLTVKVTIPDDQTGFVDVSTGSMLDPDRVKNIQISLTDRQAVFTKKDCAECHADKAQGKMGKELYDVICAICHDTPHRATMVTNFKERRPYTADVWRQWIVSGKTNTLMPAFAITEGGPLTHLQIQSLVDYLVTAFEPGAHPSEPPVPQAIAMPAVQPPRPTVVVQRPGQPAVQTIVPPVPVPAPTVQVEAPARPIRDYPFPKDDE